MTTSPLSPPPLSSPPPNAGPTPAAPRVLRRCPHHRMIAGVAAGIADYLDVDVAAVRIAVVIFALLGGLHRAYGRPRPQWNWDPRRPDPRYDSMRCSDAERTEVTNALCRHFGDGRLDESELNDRLARAAAAKTRAELAPLLADLPPFETGQQVAAPPRPHRPLAWRGVGALALITLAWSAAGATAALFRFHVPWLPLLILAFFLLRRRRFHRWY
jgi:hypothetical protein